MDGRVFVSVKEAARYYGVSKDPIYRAVHRMAAMKHEGVRRIGATWRVDLTALDELFTEFDVFSYWEEERATTPELEADYL